METEASSTRSTAPTRAVGVTTTGSTITSFSSASRAHLTWLRDRIHGATGLSGNLTETTRPLRSTVERNPFFELRYAKRASRVLLPALYRSGTPCLARKRAIWQQYASRHGLLS